jgi:hypothetical protein
MDASIAANVFTGQPLENVKKFIEDSVISVNPGEFSLTRV